MERATRFEVAKQYREAETRLSRSAFQQHPENDESAERVGARALVAGLARGGDDAVPGRVGAAIRRIRTFVVALAHRCWRGRNSSTRLTGCTEDVLQAERDA
jgi:hypothetical protein